MTHLPLLLLLAASPTYYTNVQPILERNCVACHSAGQVAPFALDSYELARKHAKTIAAVTASRRMPIWKPERGFGHFLDERRLSQDEIQTLRLWASAGAPSGKPSVRKVRPPVPVAKPDLILRMPQPVAVPAEGPDQFVCTVIPIPLESSKWVSKVEFHPGNPKVVHHSLFFLMDHRKAMKNAGSRGHYNCFGGPGGLPKGGLGGWAPGASPHEAAPGTARLLDRGLALVMQQHYHPSGKPESDQSELHVYFSNELNPRPVHGLAVRTRDIHIPAHSSRHAVKASLEIPVDVELSGVTPHMHYLGRQMKVTARLPGGAAQPLIWIQDWDFNWQGQYRYASPVRLPAGTRIDMEAIFSNPSDSEVTWGEQTNNEMAICFFEYTSTSPNAQRRILLSMAKQFVGDLF